MSASWSLPIHFSPSRPFHSTILWPERTRVVIPTFRDWDAARETVESLLDCRPRPGEIVLVDDNAEPDPPIWLRRYPIYIVTYEGNHGPAHARNAGVRLETGQLIQWLCFTDTGCTREREFFSVLAEHQLRLREGCVAIGGPVHGVTVSPTRTPINLYMTEERVLNPPFDQDGPQAVVTANAAVSAQAFQLVGGFDESYPFAAGEDLDLGLKLRRLGTIGWASEAVVHHHFEESMDDFRRRFIRYGAGTAHLEHRFGLPSLRPPLLVAKHADRQPLALNHITAMQVGYDAHRDRLLRSFERPASTADRRSGLQPKVAGVDEHA
ncbi:MAG: glycosyltransferase [Phycisphaerales bacterium]|nr:glycosyltransferase [Phycisphaerales bacterium]